jgi:seryl-tRNA synthetase
MLLSKVLSYRLFGHFTTVNVNSMRYLASSSRFPADNHVFDINMIANYSDIVVSHLKSRGCESILNDIDAIKALRKERNSLIVESDSLKNTRKVLSLKIGNLLKLKKTSEVEELKSLVEDAASSAFLADQKIVDIDKNINQKLASFPNLLDNRYFAVSD